MPSPESVTKALQVPIHVGNGLTLKKSLEIVGLSLHTFQECVSSVRTVGLAYAHAREIRADVLIDEALYIVDNEEDPQKAKVQSDMRKWIASKHKSSVYGDRIDLNVTQNISAAEAMQQARLRLMRPVIDQQLGMNELSFDVECVNDAGPADMVSVPADEPDIFT